MADTTVSLNTCSVQQPRATAQRFHMLLHFTAILAILYYRFNNLIHGDVPTLPWVLMTLSELIFSFFWLLTQPFRWCPVARTVALHNLPDDNRLPKVDVFICTADPSKEPTVEVMNTVLSAMGLDYPSDKLAVYLSDDGGAPSTLYAMKEACAFAKDWLPFCRKHGIQSRCPEWFFSTGGLDEVVFRSHQFEADEQKMKLAYEQFKEKVERITNDATVVNDRPPRIEIIHDNRTSERNGVDEFEMPLLVYVSRERKPYLPHHFKAGALNTLLRISGILSNAPYMLVLDCDMYCNEPTSAKQAMCFHLDPQLSSSLAFVQYPQIFYNASQKDIYDAQAKNAYKTMYQGMDGIGGTVCAGTCYYLKKKALYCSPNQQAYEQFKEKVERITNDATVVNDRPPRIEIIHDNRTSERNGVDEFEMPLLVYVSRERKPYLPHHFKAGALNTLLRISGILSNAPYMLVLDCDMYCNEPTSAKQAMCFHLDPQLSSSLAFVQYPQIFYNASQKDIYDAQAKNAYKTMYQGMDGIGGTVCAGTCYYLKKKALYCSPNQQGDHHLHPEVSYGESTKFIDSLKTSNTMKTQTERYTNTILGEAKKLASCSYEDNTKWGKQIGYSYNSLLESSFTGYLLHARGWKSVYLYPNRPCFLGCTTIDMKDAMVQLMKWSSGLLQVGLSRFNPLTYGAFRMPVLQSLCYAYFMYSPFLSIAFLLYGTISPLCLLNGISLYPTASNPWFKVFAMVYVSSLLEHLYVVLSNDGSLVTWWNEQRIYFIRCISALLFGCVDVVMKSLGVAKANFRLTNKVVDKKKLERYQKGTFDFEGAKMFMMPLTVMVLLNALCFLCGIKQVISNGNLDEMLGQLFVSWKTLLLSYPVLKGLVTQK